MKTNHIATSLMHHVHCWINLNFVFEKSDPPKLMLYPSKNKTRVLGMQLKTESLPGRFKKETKYNRKKWSVECMRNFLALREDDWSTNYIFIENKSKKDDLCDTLMQSLSYIIAYKCK